MLDVAGYANEILGNVEKAKLMVKAPSDPAVKKELGNLPIKAGENEQWHTMTVKYNPSKLRMSTKAGSFQQVNFGGASAGQVQQMNIPAQTSLDLELIFDDVNIQDAFMFSKFTNLSAGAIVSDISGIVKNQSSSQYLDSNGEKLKGGYSVQHEVEALIGLLVNSQTRQVKFCWANLEFAGELTYVSANYTMFNPIGNPVRATVAMTIQQVTDKDEKLAGSVKEWDKKFDKLFDNSLKTKGEVNAGKARDSLRNFVQL